MINTERDSLIGNENIDIYIVTSFLLLGYIIISIVPIFLDILFGFSHIIHCNTLEKPLIDILIWMRVNGIISFFTLIMLIIIQKKLFIPDRISYKIVHIFGIVMNIFLVLWSGIGMISFFMYYDINDNYYIMIRMGIAPAICILKLLEIYYT